MNMIGFIGGGNMAEALLKSLIETKLYPPENIFISDINSERLQYLSNTYKVRTTNDNKEVSQTVDILVLSIKPQVMADALQSIKDNTSSDSLVISIAAGVKVEKITNVLGNIGVIRVMPNTPALVGAGASAIFANDRAKPMLRYAERIFSAVGEIIFVEDENLIDAVTAVSGSGPAYFFFLMEEMTKAAVELGLNENDAKKMVLQTAKGAALLACQSQDSPAELRRKVTSPKGTTEAAIQAFTNSGFGDIINNAVKAAYRRSQELSK